MKDPRVRAATRLTATGRSQAEIAGILGVTEKAVERMLYNERVRLKKRMAG
jgi:DNA-directed RNA polymerase specialized sigma24 family protein